MSPIRRSVPSLAALVAFEAAARRASITAAAGELGVTQAAVSRHVRRLEADLGAALFARAHRRVELTDEGRRLAAVLAEAFGRVAETVEAIRARAGGDAVTVGTTVAFAHFWLVPRLPAFRAAHPGIRLRLLSDDAGFDLRPGGPDVVVRYGPPGEVAGAVELASMADEVVPVASPALAQGAALAALPLIGLDRPDPAWLGWARWAALAGVEPGPLRAGLQFNHYTDAVYAALAGEGVVLGWRRLVGPLLADGRLARVGEARAVPPDRHRLLRAAGRPGGAAAGAVAAVAAWLAREFAADP